MKSSLDLVSPTRKLLAFDTMNPPARELTCAQSLSKLLKDASFLEFGDRRKNLNASIKAR
jgi:hypothetical protein